MPSRSLQIIIAATKEYTHFTTQGKRFQNWSYGVVVSSLEFESSNLSLTPSRTFVLIKFFLSYILLTKKKKKKVKWTFPVNNFRVRNGI